MKITAIETLRMEEFANVLRVRVHTDAGLVGLGETFYGAGAVAAHIHDTFAGRLLGRNALHVEAVQRDMVNLPMAQSSTGAECRAASAVDIAPRDCTGPVGCAAAVHASFSQPNTLIQESVRAFCSGWCRELVTEVPVIQDGSVLPMEGPGLDTGVLPAVFVRPDLTVRRSTL